MNPHIIVALYKVTNCWQVSLIGHVWVTSINDRSSSGLTVEETPPLIASIQEHIKFTVVWFFCYVNIGKILQNINIIFFNIDAV